MPIMRTLTINGVTYDVESSVPTTGTVALKASAWRGDASPYYQVVALANVTPLTKVDLQPTTRQLDTLHAQSLGFYTENDGGVVTAYAVGNKPLEEFTFQVTLTEVEGGGVIRGNTVGFPNPQPDWLQEDSTQANYIKNKHAGAYIDAIGTERRVLTASDAGRFLRVDVASLIVVPPGLPVGVELEIFRNTNEAVILQPTDVSLAIPGETELVTEARYILDPYASIVLKHIAEDVWSVQGAV